MCFAKCFFRDGAFHGTLKGVFSQNQMLVHSLYNTTIVVNICVFLDTLISISCKEIDWYSRGYVRCSEEKILEYTVICSPWKKARYTARWKVSFLLIFAMNLLSLVQS
jgi:hypothetical protein